MENEWKMVVGDTTYTMEMIEEKAASGVSVRNFMDTIEPQREMDLIYGGVMKERITRDGIKTYYTHTRTLTKRKATLDELVEDFGELGLADLIKQNGDEIRYYYAGKENYMKYVLFKYSETKKKYYYLRIYRHELSGYCQADRRALLKDIAPTLKRWEEEDAVIKRIFDKAKKQRSIAENSIRIMVDDLLKDKGLDYRLEVGRTRTVLVVGLKRNRKMEISLTNKSFQKNMDSLCDTIDKIASLVNDIPLHFKITYRNEHVKA